LASTEPIPPVTSELLAWLERAFPNVLPAAPQSDLAGINAKIGEQRVIAKLRQAHNQQHEQALSGSTII
jgi:hypothetical protein